MKKRQNIPKSFSLFLVVSVLIWLLINLSKEYTAPISCVVHYEQLSQDKVLQEEPLKEITLIVKATGFKLFTASFSENKINILANNLQKIGENNYNILLQYQNNKIQEQLKSGLYLEQIQPNIIPLKLGNLQSKKVPIVLQSDIRYRVGYEADKIKITPDSALISGAASQLHKITNLKTTQLQATDVFENIQEKVHLLLPKEIGKIKLNKKEVTITVFVDKFTEGTQKVAINVENIPKGIQLTTFPKKVKVIYKVGLKNFNKVNEKSFTITCDYKETTEKELAYLVPKLVVKPKDVLSVRIIPEKIDFLVQE